MRRLLAILAVLLTGVALAQVPVGTPSPAERLAEFRRSRGLLEALVEGGLHLAVEDNPLQRAQTCNTLADRLAREVQQAAADKQGGRAADLGARLQELLVQGVAGNLDLAHHRLPADAPPPPEVEQLGQRVARVMKSTEEELERSSQEAGPENMQAAIQALSKGRAEVERAARGKPPAAGKNLPRRK